MVLWDNGSVVSAHIGKMSGRINDRVKNGSDNRIALPSSVVRIKPRKGNERLHTRSCGHFM